MGKLTGKTALIAGTPQGIGEGIAGTFARRGANLILLDVSDEIEKLADELIGRGYCYTAVHANIGDFTSVKEAVMCTRQIEDKIGILMNSTGVCRPDSFLNMSDEDRDFHTDINIKGVQNVTKAILPEMIARKDGHIVTMSSVIGSMAADPSETTYALSEAAIIGLIKSSTIEYAQSGIRVDVVCPGYVHMPMIESIMCQSNPEDPESVLVEMAKTIPIRRLTYPLEVGELTAFLTSDESSYLTDTQNVTDSGSALSESINVGVRSTPVSPPVNLGRSSLFSFQPSNH